MPALIVPCPHCTGTAQVDSATLPDQPCFFACPHCGEKVGVDKRKLLADAGTAAAPAATAPPSKAAAPAATGEGSTMVAREAPAPVAHEIPELPGGASFSLGLVVAEDVSVVNELQQVMASAGGELQPADSIEAARERIVNEQQQLCVYVAGAVGAAPYERLAALTSLPPAVRRRVFLVLVADDVTTLDGMTAFLHGVNMVVARADLPKLAAAVHCGLEFHDRMYAPYFLAETVAAGQ